jgi:hypothetical protein
LLPTSAVTVSILAGTSASHCRFRYA